MDAEAAAAGSERDRVALLECNIDDMTPEALGYALERLLDEGALDAWFTPIYMKKNRPATLLSVLCSQGDVERLGALLLRETTTLGVRWTAMDRMMAARRSEVVATPWGDVRVKHKLVDGRVLSSKPEYDDCAAIARREGLPLQAVVDAVTAALQERGGGGGRPTRS